MAMCLLKTRKMVSLPHEVALRLFRVQQGTVQGSAAEVDKVAKIERIFLDWSQAPDDYKTKYPRHYDNREPKPVESWTEKYD